MYKHKKFGWEKETTFFFLVFKLFLKKKNANTLRYNKIIFLKYFRFFIKNNTFKQVLKNNYIIIDCNKNEL